MAIDFTKYVSDEQEKQAATDAKGMSVGPANTPEEQPATGSVVGDVAVEVGRTVGGGIERAVRGTIDSAAAISPLPSSKDLLGEPVIDDPKSVMGQIGRDVIQFGLGFLGGQKILQGAGVAAKLPAVVGEVAASGVGTALVADGSAQRLSDIIQKYPILENPVTEFLASDPNDGIAEGKFKAALEDMLTTPVAMVLFAGAKAMKARLTGKTDEAATKELESSVKHADEVINVPEVQVTAKTPEQEAAEYAKLGRVTKGQENWNKLSPEQQAKIVEQIDAAPEATFSLNMGKDGEIRAFKHTVDVRNAKGEPMFTLTDEAKAVFTSQLADAVRHGDTENLYHAVEGAFNYEKMGSQFEVKATVQALADMLKPALDKHMGDVQTHREVERYAMLAGTKPDLLVANLSTWAKSAEDIPAMVVGGKIMMQSLSREINRLAQSIFKGDGGAKDEAAMLRLIDVMADVEGMTKAVQKAAARATSAGRIRTVGQDIDAAELQKMVEEAGGAKGVRKLAERIALAEGDPAKIAATVRSSLLNRLVAAHNEFWINGILSGVKTHVVNVSTAFANTLYQPATQIVGGALTRNWADVSEGIAVYKGLRTFIFDSLEMSRRAFATERAILDPGRTTDEALGLSITASNFGMKDGVKLDQIGSAKDLLAWGVDGLGKTVRMASRFLKAEDEFFKQMTYRSRLMAQATREANDLVKAGKLDPNKMVPFDDGSRVSQISEVQKWINDRFQAGFDRQIQQEAFVEAKTGGKKLLPGETKQADGSFVTQGAATDSAILRKAQEVTFTQDLSLDRTWGNWTSLSEGLQRVANNQPVLRGTVLPFIRVPANLMREAVSNSPFAPLRAQFHADIAAGGTRASQAWGKAALGSAIWTAAGILAMEGFITGAAPGDKALREAKFASGWQPYSFVFTNADGTKTYISFQRFDPFGTAFGLMADFHAITNHVDPQVRDDLALGMLLSLAQNISSKSYLKGVVELSSMLGSGYSKEDIAKRFIQMKAASYVPQWLTLYNGNDELKNVRSVTDAILAKLPGYSETVPAKRDYFGEKRELPQGYPWAAINPYTISQEKADPVRQELARLASGPSQARFTTPPEQLGNLDLTAFTNAKGQTAHDRWMELIGTVQRGGKTYHDALADLFKQDRYKNAAEGDSLYRVGKKEAMIREKQEEFRKLALDTMLKEFEADFKAGKIPQNLRELHRLDDANESRAKRGLSLRGVDRLLELAQ